jgi:hypothetical protein
MDENLGPVNLCLLSFVLLYPSVSCPSENKRLNMEHFYLRLGWKLFEVCEMDDVFASLVYSVYQQGLTL